MKNTIFVLIFFLTYSYSFAQDSKNNDFDFYFGKWEVQNKRQMDGGEWAEFSARVEAFETLRGKGNIDVFETMLYGKPYAGMTVRVYDSTSGNWQIQWYDTDKITLDPQPSIGKFTDGEGKFYKTVQTPSGSEAKVRFHWSNITENSFHWEASWSIDEINWNPTWIMDFKRIE